MIKLNQNKIITQAISRLLRLSFSLKAILLKQNLIKSKNPKKSMKLIKTIINLKKLLLKKLNHINHLQAVYKILGNPNLVSF